MRASGGILLVLLLSACSDRGWDGLPEDVPVAPPPSLEIHQRAALPEALSIELRPASPRQLICEIRGSTQRADYVIPRGARLVSDHPGVGDYLAMKRTVIRLGTVVPGRRGLDVLSCGIADLRNLPETARFRVEAPEEKVLEFLRLAEERKLGWAATQVGVWALLEDTSVELIEKVRMSSWSLLGGPATATVTGLISYQGYRKIEKLFAELGLDLESYAVCRYRRDVFALELDRLAPRAWPGRRSPPLSPGTLRSFAEPRLERAYAEVARRHPRRNVRERALRSLLAYRFPGSKAELLERALASDDRIESFAIFETLRRRGMDEVWPLLLAWEGDSQLRPTVRKAWRSLVREAKAQEREGESALDGWQRVEGWQGVTDPTLRSRLRDATRRIVERAAADPYRNFLVGLLRGEDAEIVADALSRIVDELPQDEALFGTLRRLALTHESREVRRKARYGLARMPAYDPLPTFTACFDRETRDRRIVLSQAANAKIAGLETLYVHAARTGDASVRSELRSRLGQSEWDGANALLEVIARAEPYSRSWWKILATLQRREAPQTLTLLRERLGHDRPEERVKAAERLFTLAATPADLRGEARGHLLRSLRDRKLGSSLRQRAVRALIVRADPASATLLAEFVRKGETHLARAAIYSLGEREAGAGRDEAQKLLEGIAQHPRYGAAARSVLKRIDR